MRRVLLLTVLGIGLPVAGGAEPNEPTTAERAQAILTARCVSCHGKDKQQGGLRLDSAEALKAGGDSGAAVSLRKPADSLLLRAVRHGKGVAAMPPKETLAKADIEVLTRWVGEGAPWAAARKPVVARGDAWTDADNPIRRLFNGQRLDLWSLKKPVAPALPAVKDARWSRTPVDPFILARLEAAGLKPSSEADRRTLIRRLTFDLTGIPPTPEEVRAFVEDTSPDAYEKLVDRLLASPRYGEAWARHWLDVVRYADTNGFERDEFRPQMWRYRDYVIRAFNTDKPFDRFVTEQLAGDELVSGKPTTPAEADAVTGTGFLRLGLFDSTHVLFKEDARGRDELLGDLVNTTGSAFLGLTLSCCNCHDHKYDPLSQADHFRMRAFFAGVTFADLPLGPDRVVAHGVREGKATPPVRVYFQGDVYEPREEVEAGFPSVFTPFPATVKSVVRGTTGRRTALAKWITDPANPFTARVFVNRVWQAYFGTGLVATPDDFGYAGAAPTHPELLDYLATEFVRSGWSVKHLHRLIVRSATYRQASADGPARAKDPDNRLLWRQNVRRLTAETLRDSVLAVSGRLRPDAGGPPRWPAVAAEELKAQPGIYEAMDGKDSGRRQGWYTTEPPEACDVRSIYLIQKRSLSLHVLTVFDQPDSTATRGRRDETTTAPQALTMMNNPEVVRLARAFADRVIAEVGDGPEARVERAVWLALGRAPSDAERSAALGLLKHHGERHEKKDANRDALAEVCRALVNVNEFFYVD